MNLRILTLGTLKIELDGKPLSKLPSRAAEALLIYVACHPNPVSRDTLATLFWEGRTQENARGNLRTILSGLRQSVGDYLIVTRHDVAFNHAAEYRLDCAEFESLLTKFNATGEIKTLQQAMDLYRGDFLAGFSLRDGLGFEEWMVVIQETLQRQANVGLRQLIDYHFRRGEYELSLEYIRRLQAIDPFDEVVQRQQMEALLRLGRRNHAIKSYRKYRQLLFENLSLTPDDATQTLFARIKNAKFPSAHRIPVLSSPFIGRRTELDTILRCFANIDCRLISVLGPGGIGKTSIAIQSAWHLLKKYPGQFLDGVFFIPLENLEKTSLLPCKIATVLDFKIYGVENQSTRLLNFLRDKELLLILDNFEHLISPESIHWLSQLLAGAPNVKVLLSSRGRLNLREEHTIDLRGLSYPATKSTQNPENFSAIQLFLQHANRVRHKFEPAPDEMSDIINLCQMVDGMPLAIELAAAETRYFPCKHIVSEIEKRLDFQSAPADNRPPRHASLRATIEYSWTLLSESEPVIDVARRLAVFHGAFDLPAAIAVTHATPHQLVSLVDRSFLQRNTAGFFELHPLIQQFLAEKLAEHPTEAQETNLRHANWYTELIKIAGGHEHENMERHFFKMKQTVETHFDNIVAAALYLARRHHFSERRLTMLIESLIFYFEHAHRYRQWKTIFKQIIDALHETSDPSYEARWLTLVLFSRIAQADILLHAYRRAEKQLQTILPDVYALQNNALISACLEMLALLSARAGKFDLATKQAEESLAAVADYPNHYQWSVYRTLGDIALDAGNFAHAQNAHKQAFALAVEAESEAEALPVYKLAMGKIARRTGDADEARQFLSEALNAARPIGKHEDTIACLMELAWVLTDFGELAAAEKLLTEADSLNMPLADFRLGALLALVRGRLAEAMAHPKDAEKLYRHSTAVFAEIDDRVNLSQAQKHLAHSIEN